VKHGIKYTGMPAWVAQSRDDEVWALVAFLKRLPALDVQSYRALAMGSVKVAEQSGRDIATADATTEAMSACARCHGAENRAPLSKLVPILHGQPREFLAAALQAFSSGNRDSGIMEPVATDLAADTMRKVAEFYAGLTPPASTAASAAEPSLAIGRSLAREGLPSGRIPPCLTCHDSEALAQYPRLAGQNAPYMINRLRLWKNGGSPDKGMAEIMGPIARLLSEEQIDAVSAYFASLPAVSSGNRRRP
ncbi:MAG TPA: cytochrome C, partial [Dongiaceae bacterium]